MPPSMVMPAIEVRLPTKIVSLPPPALIVRLAPATAGRFWLPARVVSKSNWSAKIGGALRLWLSRPFTTSMITMSSSALPLSVATVPLRVAVKAAWAGRAGARSAASSASIAASGRSGRRA